MVGSRQRERSGWGRLAGVVVLLLALASGAGRDAWAARGASIVVDFGSGSILHADDADAAVYPASLTKTMTLYLLFDALRAERVKMSTQLKVSQRAAGMPPSRLGLPAGSTISVKDAILALITKSANDVAVVVAEHLGGSEVAFARTMTARAKQLGMSRTQFRNASGLPHGEQRTTARDMAQLGIRLISDHPEHYHLFSTRQFKFRGRTYRNHNGLLYRYKGADGMKTGYIRASGFNLLASAVRGERRLIAAVFGGKSARARDTAMAGLLDKAFSRGPSQPVVATKGKLGDRPKGPDRSETLIASIPKMRPTTGLAQGDLAAVEAVAARSATPAAPVAKLPAARPGSVRGYAVQVGAFRSAGQAEKAAAGAARKAPTLLAGLDPQVNPVKSGKRTLYRAWLVGLSESQARTACRQLEKARQDCLVVRL